MLSKVKEQNEAVSLLQRVVSGALVTPCLLIGPEGVGKRMAVTETAKERFSLSGSADQHIAQISGNCHPDFRIVGGAEDIGVDDIREVVASTAAFPSSAPVRFIVIDGADRMTLAAADALLKTLEEPHATTQFFLLTSDVSRVSGTIRSRCGEIRFNPLSEALILQAVQQQTDDPTKALVYSRISEGSIGRALQYLGSGRLALRDSMLGLVRKGLAGDVSSLFEAVDKVNNLQLGLRFLAQIVRDLTLVPYDPNRVLNIDVVREIEQLRQRMSDAKLVGLQKGVGALQRLSPSMNLSFHTKTALVSALVG